MISLEYNLIPKSTISLNSRMMYLAVFAALLQLALSGHVAVQLPYLNPAGVNYVGGPVPQYEHEAYDHAPLQYAQHPQNYAYSHPEPLQYAAHGAHVEAHHVGYATAQVPAVAAVPVVKHVPAVAQVPVTHIEAQHGYVEKQVDVAKPAVATRKFQVRRPAIQKQFYDIEERVIVRPAGSALLELDEPLSKVQKGPTVVQPIAHAAPLSVTPVPDHEHHHLEHEHHGEAFVHVTPAPGFVHHEDVHHHETVHVTPAPVVISSPAPTPVIVSSTPAPHFEDNDSVVVENVEFRNAVASLRQKERQLEDLQHQQVVLQAELQAERDAHVSTVA